MEQEYKSLSAVELWQMYTTGQGRTDKSPKTIGEWMQNSTRDSGESKN